jgi:hypothetical protein
VSWTSSCHRRHRTGRDRIAVGTAVARRRRAEAPAEAVNPPAPESKPPAATAPIQPTTPTRKLNAVSRPEPEPPPRRATRDRAEDERPKARPKERREATRGEVRERPTRASSEDRPHRTGGTARTYNRGGFGQPELRNLPRC